MIDSRTAKLPKWAQHRIKQLESNVEYWKAKALAVTSQEGTRVELDTFKDEPTYLPEGFAIRFRLGRNRMRDYVTCRLDELANGRPKLYLNGAKTIVVRPESYNAISVFFEES